MKVLIQETLYVYDGDTGWVKSMMEVTTEGDSVVDKPKDVATAHREAMEKLLKEDK